MDVALPELKGNKRARALDVESGTVVAISPLNRLDGPAAFPVEVSGVSQKVRGVHGRSVRGVIRFMGWDGFNGGPLVEGLAVRLRDPSSGWVCGVGEWWRD
jgi:hypothetical protein